MANTTAEQLVRYVEMNNLDKVKQAICEEGLSVDTRDIRSSRFGGGTLLSRACYYGYYEMAEFLLSQKASVDVVDNCSRTPLHECISAIMIPKNEKARINAQELITLLVRYGVNPTIATNDTNWSITPIKYAFGRSPYNFLKDALLETYQYRIATLKTVLRQAHEQLAMWDIDKAKDSRLRLRLWVAFISQIFQAILVRLNELQCLCNTLMKAPHQYDLLSIIYQCFELNQQYTQRCHEVLLERLALWTLKLSPSQQSWLTDTFEGLKSLWVMPYQQMIILPWLHKDTTQPSSPRTAIASSSTSTISEETVSSEPSIDELCATGLLTKVPITIVTLSPFHRPVMPIPDPSETKSTESNLWDKFVVWAAAIPEETPSMSQPPMTSLHQAITVHNTGALISLLKQDKTRINMPDRAGVTPLQLALQQHLASALWLLQQGADVHGYVHSNPHQEHLTSYYLHGAETHILRLLGLYGGRLHECLAIRQESRYKSPPYSYPLFEAEIMLLSAQASYQLRQMLLADISTYLNTISASSSTSPPHTDISPEIAWYLLQRYRDIGELWWREGNTAYYPRPGTALELNQDHLCRRHYQAQAVSAYQEALRYFSMLGDLQYGIKNLRNTMFDIYSRIAELSDKKERGYLQTIVQQAAYFSQSWRDLWRTAHHYFKKLNDKPNNSLSISSTYLQQNEQQLQSLHDVLRYVQSTHGKHAWKAVEVRIDIIQAYITLARVADETQTKTDYLNLAYTNLLMTTESLSAVKYATNTTLPSDIKAPLAFCIILIQAWISCYSLKASQVDESHSSEYIRACFTCGQEAEAYYKSIRRAVTEEHGSSLLTQLQTLYEILQQAYCVILKVAPPELQISKLSQLRHRKPKSSSLFTYELPTEASLETMPLLTQPTLSTSAHDTPNQRIDWRARYHQLLIDYSIHINQLQRRDESTIDASHAAYRKYSVNCV